MSIIKEESLKKIVYDYVVNGIGTRSSETMKRYIRDAKKNYPDWWMSILKHKDTDKHIKELEEEGVKSETKIEDKRIDHTLILRNRFTTVEQLAEFCKIDLKKWKAVKITANEWNTSRKYKCWQFKVTWELIDGLTVDNILDAIREVNAEVPAKLPKYTPKTEGFVALEVSVPDLHLGRLAWEYETGGNYDVKIAYNEWIKAHQYFSRLTHIYDTEVVVIPIGNDYFNVDNASGTTTAGTTQDEDGRWQRSFQYGYMAAINAIEIYRKLGLKVVVKIVPGNHDWERNYYLGFALSVAYKDCEEVEIDNSPAPRKYFVYGRNMIGFSHGKEDKDEIKHIYQSEMREYMSQCDNIEMHLAHLHIERVVEQNGSVILRTIPSLAQRNAWETGKGYSGNRRAQAFVWSKNRGLLNINYYTPYYEEK